MSSVLTVCQPGWLAVFKQTDGDGYFTEPVACWLLHEGKVGESDAVHPICALGGDICDATSAENYLGVVGPGGKPELLVDAARASRAKQSA